MPTEGTWRNRNAPGRIDLRKLTTRICSGCEPTEHAGFWIEQINQSASAAGFGFGEHDKHPAADHLHIERSVPGRCAYISELPDETGIRTVNVECAFGEIRCEQECAVGVGCDGEPGVRCRGATRECFR